MDARVNDPDNKRWRNLWGKSLGRTRKPSRTSPLSVPPAAAEMASLPRPTAAPRPLPLRPRRGPPQSHVANDTLLSAPSPYPALSRPVSETTQTTSSSASRTSRASHKTIKDGDPEWDELQPAIPMHARQEVEALWPQPDVSSHLEAIPRAPVTLSLPHQASMSFVQDSHSDGSPEGFEVFGSGWRQSSRIDGRRPSQSELQPPSQAAVQAALLSESRRFSETESRASPMTKMRAPSRIGSRPRSQVEPRVAYPVEERVPSRTEAWAPPWASIRPLSRSRKDSNSRAESRPQSRAEARGAILAEACTSPGNGVLVTSPAQGRASSRSETGPLSRAGLRPSSQAEVQSLSGTEIRTHVTADLTSSKAPFEIPLWPEPDLRGETVVASVEKAVEKAVELAQRPCGGAVPDRYAIRSGALTGASSAHNDSQTVCCSHRVDSAPLVKDEELVSLRRGLESSHRLPRSEGTEQRFRPSSGWEETTDPMKHQGMDAVRTSKDKKRWSNVPWPRVDSSLEREKEERRPPRERKNPPASLSSGAAHASIIMTSPPKQESRGRRSSGSPHSRKPSDERPQHRWTRSHSLGASSSPCLNGTAERSRKGSSASAHLSQAMPWATAIVPIAAVKGASATARETASMSPSKERVEHDTSTRASPLVDTSDESPPCPAAVAPTHFHRIRLLGQGDVGRVYLVRDRYTGTVYAMKVLNKKDLVRRDKVRRALTEQQILLHTRHPFIIRLHHTFQSADFLFLCLDYARGGELFTALREYDPPVLSEKSARFYAAEVALALGYLHTQGVVYRDLKPENLLLNRKGHLLLSDFDLSARAPNGDLTGYRTNSLVGTLVYLAPEVIRGEGHTIGVDWWTLGILIYEMVHAAVPFEGETQDDTFDMILESDVQFPTPPLMGRRGTSFIRELLTKDEKTRLGVGGVRSVQAHTWFKGFNWDQLPFLDPPLHPCVPDLKVAEQPEQPGGRPPVRQDLPMRPDDPFATFESVSLDAA